MHAYMHASSQALSCAFVFPSSFWCFTVYLVSVQVVLSIYSGYLFGSRRPCRSLCPLHACVRGICLRCVRRVQAACVCLCMCDCICASRELMSCPTSPGRDLCFHLLSLRLLQPPLCSAPSQQHSRCHETCQRIHPCTHGPRARSHPLYLTTIDT